jgi:hypothetical protein
MADVPESVSKIDQHVLGRDQERVEVRPLQNDASRSSRVVIFSGSTILMRNGSMIVFMR